MLRFSSSHQFSSVNAKANLAVGLNYVYSLFASQRILGTFSSTPHLELYKMDDFTPLFLQSKSTHFVYHFIYDVHQSCCLRYRCLRCLCAGHSCHLWQLQQRPRPMLRSRPRGWIHWSERHPCWPCWCRRRCHLCPSRFWVQPHYRNWCWFRL